MMMGTCPIDATAWRPSGPAYRGVTVAACALLLVLTPQPSADAQVFVDARNVNLLREAIFSGLASQIGTLPSPSIGGVTFEFDPVLGVPVRTPGRFGPIFAERAETTGRGTVTLMASYSRYTFDKADGVPLESGAFKFLIVGLTGTDFRLNVMELRETVRAEILTLGGLYGLTDAIDIGVIVPIVRVSVKERFGRSAFFDCPADFQEDLGNCTRTPTDDRLRPSDVESTGLGDVLLRGKYNFLRRLDVWGGRLGLAAGLDLRLPTGDEADRNALKAPSAGFFVDPSGSVESSGFRLGDPPQGTGIVRVKPQFMASGSWFGVAPHVNVGAELGTTEGITNDFVYAVGFDYTLLRRATVAVDLLGRHVVDVERRRVTRAGPGSKANPDTLTLSVGVKINPFGTLLVFGNVLIALNDTGVRDELTPTVGLEWSF